MLQAVQAGGSWPSKGLRVSPDLAASFRAGSLRGHTGALLAVGVNQCHTVTCPRPKAVSSGVCLLSAVPGKQGTLEPSTAPTAHELRVGLAVSTGGLAGQGHLSRGRASLWLLKIEAPNPSPAWAKWAA